MTAALDKPDKSSQEAKPEAGVPERGGRPVGGGAWGDSEEVVPGWGHEKQFGRAEVRTLVTHTAALGATRETGFYSKPNTASAEGGPWPGADGAPERRPWRLSAEQGPGGQETGGRSQRDRDGVGGGGGRCPRRSLWGPRMACSSGGGKVHGTS